MRPLNAQRLVCWVVSDSPHWRAALRLMLVKLLPTPCALTDASAADLPGLLHHDQPDLVIWDRQATDWISAVQMLSRKVPAALHVVIASSWTFEEKTMARALGVHHCLQRSDCAGTLRTLLHHVPGNSPVAARSANTGMSLTPREQEIVIAVQRGLDNKSIARLLGISPSTVKTHLHHVFDKLGVTRTQLLLRGR